jgi:chromosome segregation ATPase
LIEIFPDLESVRLDINEYLERPKEVLSMFSEALRILDRNTAELMVDRMKDEIDELKVQAEENRARLEEKDSQLEENRAQLEEKDAEIARLKKLLEKQNK